MGINEDSAELPGSEYDRKLYDLRQGHAGPYLARVGERWELTSERPGPGEGAFVERMPDGELRRWFNTHQDH